MTLRPSIILLVAALGCVDVAAQAPKQFLVSPASTKPPVLETSGDDAPSTSAKTNTTQPSDVANGTVGASNAEVPKTANPQFRIERLPIANGAELLTIFGRLDGVRTIDAGRPEVPLISVVRDTLSDTEPDNDRLRYV